MDISNNLDMDPERYIHQFLSDPNINLQIYVKYNKLKDIFIKYNTALPSSAPSECLFSTARKCLDYCRTRISDQHFEAQLLVKANKFKKTL